eukprot:03103.XXX_59994_61033_1 [CDS] Oithona nana genome sequencing.
MSDGDTLSIVIKWAAKEYPIDNVPLTKAVQDLKNAIHVKTNVLPARQKLLNLRFKGKAPSDDQCLSSLSLKNGTKIMMMGSVEQAIQDVNEVPTDLPEVINDFDEDTERKLAIEHREEYLNKVAQRVQNYEVKILNELREDKKLLVLDIDYTLFDHRTPAETGAELMRPHLHDFLTAAYNDYDIVIWSATSMKWIEEKMKLLGCDRHPGYKLAFYLDSRAMISIHAEKYGVIEVKPLGVIWDKFPRYNKTNTIMFDDLRRNFLMNPANGLKIKPFKNAHTTRKTDKELIKLSAYLKKIATLTSFEGLDHKHWESYLIKSRDE